MVPEKKPKYHSTQLLRIIVIVKKLLSIFQVRIIRILANLPDFYQVKIRMNWDLYDFQGDYGYCIEIQTLKTERIFGTVI